MALGYKDIKNSIHQEILSGKLEPGSRLPTGKELCEIHSVSNLTVDRALRELVKEGLICRHRQKGTFVADMLDRSHGAIALLIPTLSSLSTFPQFADGVQKALHQRNYQLVLEHTQMDINLTLKAVHKVVRDGVKGVIYVPATSPESFERNAEALNYLRKNNIPVVVAGHCDIPGLEWVSGVSSDHYTGAKTLVNHLVKCGHRRIGMFGCVTNSDHQQIIKGYKAAMEENHLNVSDRWVCTFDPMISASNKVKQFVQAANDITAIFAIGDTFAAEIMVGLTEIGIRIPEDLALVGFGDHPICRYLPVGLTTVHVQHKEEGELLAGMLLDVIKGNLNGPSRIELPCPLVIRKSCGVGLKSKDLEVNNVTRKSQKRVPEKGKSGIGQTASKRVAMTTVGT